MPIVKMAFTSDMAGRRFIWSPPGGSSGQASTTGVDSPAFADMPVLDFNIEEFLVQHVAQTAPALKTVAGRTPNEAGSTQTPSYVAPSILERRLAELRRHLPDISAIHLPVGVSVQRARTLLMHYLIAQIRSDSGNVAVHELAIRGDVENLQFYADLMVAFKHGEGVNIQNWAGQTALHVARGGDAVHVLVKRGALLDVRDGDGETPIHAAARAHRTEVLAALLHHCGTNVALAEHKNLQGFTALHLAVMYQGVEDRQHHLLQLLLDARVDVNITDDTGGRSALFHAVLRGDEMTVRELILSGAAVNMADFSDSTPLQVAEELPPTPANVAICTLLIENGGFNIPPADRVNPDHTASAGVKRRRVQ